MTVIISLNVKESTKSFYRISCCEKCKVNFILYELILNQPAAPEALPQEVSQRPFTKVISTCTY